MTVNQLFNQLQADVLGRSIVCSKMTEISGLGAAIAAGIGSQHIELEKLENHLQMMPYHSKINAKQREIELNRWREAVRRARNWTF